MPVKMNPTSVIKANLGINPGGKVQKFFTNTCALHMDKYVPMDEGILANTVVSGGSVTGNVKTNSIHYEQPYARYVYYGQRQDGTHVIKNYSKDKHPLAGSYWDRKMVSAEFEDVIEEVQNFLKRGGK